MKNRAELVRNHSSSSVVPGCLQITPEARALVDNYDLGSVLYDLQGVCVQAEVKIPIVDIIVDVDDEDEHRERLLIEVGFSADMASTYALWGVLRQRIAPVTRAAEDDGRIAYVFTSRVA